MKVVCISIIAACASLVSCNAKSMPMEESVYLPAKTCTSMLAGMYNDAKQENGVVVEYTGSTLTLEGNGKSYFVTCERGMMSFAGSRIVEPN